MIDWLRKRLLRHPTVAALLLGALGSLAFAPLAWWPLGLVSVAGLVCLWENANSPRACAYSGFAFAFGWFQAGTYWLYICLVGNGGVPLWLALVLMLGLTSLMGAYTALFAYGLVFPLLRSALSRWVKGLLLASGLTLVELFRGWFLSGFPWLALGYSGLNNPLAGFAPITGVYGISVILYGLAVALGLSQWRPTRLAWIALSGSGIFALGFGLSQHAWTRVVGTPVSVALVQGAIPQDEKWQRGREVEITGRYLSLTEQAFGQQLIVWPESSLPYLYQDAQRMLLSLNALARQAHSTLVLGLIHAKDEHYYNGIAVIGEHTEWYDKRHLVPFGEYFPVPSFVRRWMRLAQLPYTDFTPGIDPPPVLHAAGQTLGGSVCYEDAFNEEQRAFLAQVTLLVNVTNDTWFGDSSAPFQHLEISRMRALEAGRYLVRVANSGISAIIGPDGRIISRSDQFVPMVLKGQVMPMSGLTPFARVGNTPLIGLLLLPWLIWLWRRFKAHRSARLATQSADHTAV
jgi:apolipoprotein N-acyltransferase